MSIQKKYHIVGICGSLRKKSFNRGLLQAISNLNLDNITFTLADISSLPFYNQDYEYPFPEAVVDLSQLLKKADCIIISTPEYNSSFSGVLKNALEWLSRKTLGSPLKDKPAGIMGATTVHLGTAQAQSQLRQVLFSLGMKIVPRPLVMISDAKEKFDANGELIDEQTKDLVKQLVEEVIKTVEK